MPPFRCALAGAGFALLAGCAQLPAGPATAPPRVAAATEARHREFAALNLQDAQDDEDARRGLVAKAEGRITRADGTVIADFSAFDFVQGEPPATVNPTLWRHARRNVHAGLFKVTDGVWQLRGFDISNITLVEGRTGWIVIDTLTAKEAAAAAMAFARRHLGDKPVTGIVFTHSHADHFGGVLGVVTAADAAARRIPVVASEGFMEESTSENVLVGTAMGRRAMYQFGRNLERSPLGNIDTGLGKTVVGGSIGILPPTLVITKDREEHVIDGVRFVFHNVPGAEAPAELTFSIPERKVYGGAENLAQTMHNLLPVRGAKVRDSLRWAHYLQNALDQLGDAEVYVGQHNWPVWGHQRIVDFIRTHRDVYKYTHDQTVRLINAGYTPREIAERVKLPKSLQSAPGARGYYGDLRHNVKAVYQFYLGAYDGNPARLDPLPPDEAGRRYVELLGGPDKVVVAAQAAYDRGEFRWAAELLDHVLQSGDHAGARELQARTFEQLGYVSEAATWRNSYLTAAQEVRHGPPARGVDRASIADVLARTPMERFLEVMAASLNGPAAEGQDLKVNLALPDVGESYVLWIENAVLHHRAAPADPAAHVSLTLTRPLFLRLMAGGAGGAELAASPDLKITGSRVDLARFLGLFERPAGAFAIVTRKGGS